MELVNVEIQVPKGMTIYINTEDKEQELERNAMLLYPFINNLKISHGKAAELLGIKKQELIDLYDKMGIPYINQDIADVEQEVAFYGGAV